MIARALGARVVAVDVSSEALHAAGALGAERLIKVDPDPGLTTTSPDAGVSTRSVNGRAHPDMAHAEAVHAEAVHTGAGDAVRAVTGGGAHVSLDAFGSEATCLASIASLRPRGRHVQVGLLVHGQPVIPMGRVLAEELTIVGSHGLAAHDYPALLELVASGALDPRRLVARTIGLGDAPAVLAALGESSGGGMTVIDLSG